ncbi:MFS transporter [Rhodovarius crocodyli]|uniref:MFS transporter n=1 Tax=Rhodovarius crocodyli TaxID=1979269 RepID=A0A437MET0_9PROT|nr:MFS transporter [Rhodovarius crocodyli]RVT96171.1 MFS transporter [Rhodovarius crocodyli]
MLAALLGHLIGFANYAAILPALRAATGFTEAEAGIAGGAFFLAYAIGSPIFAGLTDTRDARRLYMLGAAFGIAGGLLFPLLSASFPALVAGRVLTGIGMAGTYMPGLRILMAVLPPERQQQAASEYVSTLTLGLSASFAVSGLLEMLIGWQAAFTGAACTAAAAVVLVRATMPAPRIRPSEGSLGARLWKVLRLPRMGLFLIAVGGNSWEGMAFRTWWIALLTFTALAPGNEAYVSWNFALLTTFVGPLAMPLSTWVARRAEAGRRHRVIALASGSSAILGLILALTMEGPFLFVFILSAVYVCAIFSDAGSLTPAILVRVPVAERGAALALQSTAGNLAAFLATIVAGLVLNAGGGVSEPGAWRLAMLSILAGSAVTSLLMLILDRDERRRTPR